MATRKKCRRTKDQNRELKGTNLVVEQLFVTFLRLRPQTPPFTGDLSWICCSATIKEPSDRNAAGAEPPKPAEHRASSAIATTTERGHKHERRNCASTSKVSVEVKMVTFDLCSSGGLHRRAHVDANSHLCVGLSGKTDFWEGSFLWKQ